MNVDGPSRDARKSPLRHSMLLLALSILVCRMTAGHYLVPPWQNPDESSHFAYAWTLAQGEGYDLETAERERIERDVLGSMAAFDWWRQYKEATPDPIPTRFQEVSDHITSPGGAAQPVYYLIAATYLKVLPFEDLLSQYAALRLLSMTCALLTLVAAWAGARLLFGELTGAVVALIIALHPQFLLVGLTVGPDALVNLLGGIIWWQAARMVRERTPIVSMTIMLVCAAAIVFTKRLGAPVAAAVLPLIGMYLLRELWRRPRRAAAASLILCGGVAALLAIVWAFPEELETLKYSWGLFLRPPAAWSPRASTWEYFAVYTQELLDSSWLVAGYLRYPAPAAWRVATYLLMAIATIGVARVVVQRRPAESSAGVWLALGFALVQLVAVYLTTYTTAFGAQGRYLFPVCAPLAVLLWVGFSQWWPMRARALAASVCVGALFVLDVSGWATVLLPAYVY